MSIGNRLFYSASFGPFPDLLLLLSFFEPRNIKDISRGGQIKTWNFWSFNYTGRLALRSSFRIGDIQPHDIIITPAYTMPHNVK